MLAYTSFGSLQIQSEAGTTYNIFTILADSANFRKERNYAFVETLSELDVITESIFVEPSFVSNKLV